MKRVVLFLLANCMISGLSAQWIEWQNPDIPELHREYPSPDFISYTNREDALKSHVQASPYYKALDGVWKHKRFPSALELPAEVFAAEYTTSGWENVSIPQKKAPSPPGDNATAIPADVPVDVFRTEFHVPFAWADKQLFIELKEARSGVSVFVNGEMAGYAEDSKNPAVYDVTALAKEGNNVLVIAAAGWSTGSQLECDSRTSGEINGSVFVKALPKLRVRDFEIRTDLTDNYRNGVLEFGVVVKSHLLNPKDVRVHFELFSPEGEMLKTEYKDISLRLRQEQMVHFDALLPDVKAWSAEQPNLYSVMIRVQYEGRYVEYIQQKVGFRSIEDTGGEIRINGKPIRFRGINIDDFPTETDAMTAAFRWMKRHHVNAIRLIHTPQPERFYEMCDEYGFYLLSEAHIDSRAYGFAPESTLGNNPAYLKPHLDRTRAMYERTKNHPSALLFSLGGQGGNGYNFYETYLWMKSREKNRPVLYAGAGREWNTDIYAPNVLLPTEYEKEKQTGSPRACFIINQDRPLGEWSEMYSEAGVQGSFVGHWQGGLTDNAEVIADFGSVVIRPNVAAGKIEVTNHFDFTSLDRFELTYEVLNGTRSMSKGTIPCPLAPGETGTFDFSLPRRQGVYEYRFTWSVREPFGIYRKGDILAETSLMAGE